MRVFELYFNPKRKQDSVFDSFAYEPESADEKSLGSLYVAGELTRVLPQNKDFLNDVAGTIQSAFYGKGDILEAMRSANEFFDKEAKSGNVNWLGNINLAVLNIRDSILNFTKVGNAKILLLREGEVLDISQNLELQDQEPYPLKVFSNIASGKLSTQDKIIIMTKELFSAISKNEEFLSQLCQAGSEKETKNIFKIHREAFSEISGMCLLIMEGGVTPKIAVFPKKIILIVILILILAAAFFLFRDKTEQQKEEPKNQAQEKLEEAKSKIMMGENLIIMRKDEKAQVLFQEAWDILEPFKTEEAASLRESIEKYLND